MENELTFLSHFITEPIYLTGVEEDKREDRPVGDKKKEPKLVEATATSKGTETEPASITFHGQNHKQVVVVVDIDEQPIHPTKEYKLLLRIMAAVQLAEKEFITVNLKENHNLQLNNIIKQFSPAVVLVFGRNLNEKFFPSPNLYQTVILKNVKVIGSENLTVLERRKEEKKKLWSTLKREFDL